jgi:hypothetical protein
MSRSKKHTPITANTCAETTRHYKKLRAGIERAHERDLLRNAIKGDEIAQEQLEVESSPWDEWVCERDGKHWIGNLPDLKYKNKLMRK